jgi:hypothetical protein
MHSVGGLTSEELRRGMCSALISFSRKSLGEPPEKHTYVWHVPGLQQELRHEGPEVLLT